MSIRVPHPVGRLRAQRPHRQAGLDAAVEPAAERAARPGVQYDAAARPEMNLQERVIFTVYVVMGTLIVAFLAATGVLWWLGA
jgi:hypothetical protein